MMYVWFILMIVCAILFGVAIMGADEAWKPVSLLCGFLIFLGLFCVSLDNKIALSKKAALEEMGHKAITKEQIYQTPQSDLDKMEKIVTLKGTFYFPKETKE